MKKFLVLILTLICSLSTALLSACGDDKKDNGGNQNQQQEVGGNNDEQVSQTKTETVTLVTAAYNTATANLTAEEKLTLDIVYNYIIEKIQSQTGKLNEVQAEVTKLVNEFNTVVTLVSQTTSTVLEAKTKALAELQALYNYVIKIVPASTNAVKAIYDEMKNQLETAVFTAVEQVKAIALDFKTEIYSYVGSYVSLKLEEYKEIALAELEAVITKAINAIPYEDLKNKINEFYEGEREFIRNFNDTANAKNLIKRVKDDAVNKIKEIALGKLTELKTVAKTEIDTLVKSAIAKVNYEPYKTDLSNYYNTEAALIDGITSIEVAKTAIDKIKLDTENFIKEEIAKALTALKTAAKTEIDTLVKSAIAKVNYEPYKTDLSNYYNTEAALIDGITSIEVAKTAIDKIKLDTENFIKEEIAKALTALKTAAKTEIDTLVNGAISKVEDEEIKTDLSNYYNTEVALIDGITSIEVAKTAIDKIKLDTENFLKEEIAKQVTKYKTLAKGKLDALFNETVSKVDDESIKASLTTAYNNSIAEIAKVNSIETAKTASEKVVTEFTTAVSEIVKTVIGNLVNKYKTEITNVYNNATKPLSTQSKNALKAVYDDACTKLEGAKSLDDISKIIAEFKTNTKNYVVEALNAVIAKLGQVPEPWNFLPKTLGVTSKVVSEASIPTYEDFTNVSQIPQNYIGKQLNAVYTVLNKMTTALSYVNRVYSVFGTVGTVYNTIFDNANGQDIVLSVGEFDLTIKLTEKEYSVSTEISSVTVLIYADLENSSYGARIQLANNTVLKYTVTNSNFVMAIDVLDTLVAEVDFVKTETETIGYVYETVIAKDKTLTSTSALIEIKNGYTTIVGNKGDFIPTSGGINCEVYENSTGKFVGSEVYEEISDSKYYDTVWYNLYDIQGINSIKKVDKSNGVNPDTIYINGSTDTIHTKNVSITDWSRRFDIEFKTVYAFIFNAETNEYESVTFEVPMMFIQESHLDTFASDYEEKNGKSVEKNSIAITASSTVQTQINYGYHTLVEAYKVIKESVTYQDIVDYCKE